MTVDGRARKACASLTLDVLLAKELKSISQAMRICVYSHGEHVVEVNDNPKMIWMIAEGHAWSTQTDVTTTRCVVVVLFSL